DVEPQIIVRATGNRGIDFLRYPPPEAHLPRPDDGGFHRRPLVVANGAALRRLGPIVRDAGLRAPRRVTARDPAAVPNVRAGVQGLSQRLPRKDGQERVGAERAASG